MESRKIDRFDYIHKLHRKSPKHPIFATLGIHIDKRPKGEPPQSGIGALVLWILWSIWGLIMVSVAFEHQLFRDVIGGDTLKDYKAKMGIILLVVFLGLIMVSIIYGNVQDDIKKEYKRELSGYYQAIHNALSPLSGLLDKDFTGLLKDVAFWDEISLLPQSEHRSIFDERVKLLKRRREHQNKVNQLRLDISRFHHVLSGRESETLPPPVLQSDDVAVLSEEYKRLKTLYLQKQRENLSP